MNRRRNWIVIGGATVLVIPGVFAASYRPNPYPFLDKFRVVETSRERGMVRMVVAADFATVYRAIKRQPDCLSYQVDHERGYGQLGFRGGPSIAVGRDLSSFSSKPSRFRESQCVVVYKDQPTYAERVWARLGGWFGRDSQPDPAFR